MIEFRGVSASYALETPIVNDMSFTIRDGEFVAFVGTNGAGKSTTMRLINGLLKPTAGQVLIDGVPTTELKVSELAARVGFLFQNPDRQICCKTVAEEMRFGLRATGQLNDETQARADQLLAEFGLDPDAEPFLLNRGARQLLALLSVIVVNPPVLILDEPTTGLDFRECEQVMQTVRRLNEAGTTIVMVCHDMEVVADFAKRVIAVTGGRIVADGPTFEVFRDEAALRRADLIPPQVVAIARGAALAEPDLVGTPVYHANTLEDMAVAVLDCVEKRRSGQGNVELADALAAAAALGETAAVAAEDGFAAAEFEPRDPFPGGFTFVPAPEPEAEGEAEADAEAAVEPAAEPVPEAEPALEPVSEPAPSPETEPGAASAPADAGLKGGEAR
ncbi:MAG: ABC transporter ATP-binding protein [Eggerthellaceae bacterium]|nr:ABC transporter ATP-binding protein [Eggerthellaceae bacterium]